MACKCQKARLAQKQASLSTSSTTEGESTVVVQFLDDTTIEYPSGAVSSYKSGDMAVLSFSVFEALYEYTPDTIRRRA